MKKVFLLVIAMLATLWASAGIEQGTVRSNGLDFNNDGTCEFSWTYNNTYITYDNSTQTNIWGDDVEWDAPKSLTEGTSIGFSANWSGYGDCSIVGFGETSAIPVGQNVYLGFRIEYADGIHYGWARVSVSGSNYEYTANWQAIYYETTPNTPINAGATGGVTPPTTYTIAVSASPANAGTVTGGGSYEQGASVTVTATANNGYTFQNWTENGNIVSTNAAYTFSATANRTLVANFQQNSTPSDTYTVTTFTNPMGSGYTIGEWDDIAGSLIQFPAGSTVTLEAVASTGYTFLNWTENTADGPVVSTTAIYSFTINSNRILYANFTNGGGSENTVSINATANPAEGGRIEGTGNYELYSFATLTAIPNEGYRFVNWTENGNQISAIAEYFFTVMRPLNLVANFELVSTAVNENIQHELIITCENLLVNVRNAENENVTIYDINGRVIATAKQMESERSYSVPTSGIYFVKVGTQTRKIAVIE